MQTADQSWAKGVGATHAGEGRKCATLNTTYVYFSMTRKGGQLTFPSPSIDGFPSDPALRLARSATPLPFQHPRDRPQSLGTDLEGRRSKVEAEDDD